MNQFSVSGVPGSAGRNTMADRDGIFAFPKSPKIQAFSDRRSTVFFKMPTLLAPGEWELVIDAKDKAVHPKTVATIRLK